MLREVHPGLHIRQLQLTKLNVVCYDIDYLYLSVCRLWAMFCYKLALHLDKSIVLQLSIDKVFIDC